MRILICVFFNAQHGGLHDNIFSTIQYCIKDKSSVTVLCKPGEFESKLKSHGIEVITTDFTDIDETVEKVLKTNAQYDVIHTHPFKSREVAVKLSEKLSIPLFVTMHGMYTDSIEKNVDKFSAIFTVSEGIRDYLSEILPPTDRYKLHVIPNGVNLKLFKSNRFSKSLRGNPKSKQKTTIALVTRLDIDKEFIIRVFYDALKFTKDFYENDVKWVIVGDGSLATDVQKEVRKIIDLSDQTVDFIGWKEGKALVNAYMNSDIIIAPGRCALEGMACGKPVIAIGSKGYVGTINYSNWLRGIYTNFGGLGKKAEEYVQGSIENDLKVLLEDHEQRKELGELGLFITSQFYNEEQINAKLINIYKINVKSK